MKQRLLTIALALVLAVIGTVGVASYVKRADARALAGMRAVSVLVAQQKIPSGTAAGTALHDGLLASQNLPASAVPASALRSITPALSPLVLSSALQPGELLLRQTLVVSTHVAGGLAIPPGMIAVTARFCLPEAVAGNIQAGSQVAVFETVMRGGSGASAGAACTGPHSLQGQAAQTILVLGRVRVLAVGEAGASSGNANAAPAGQGSVLLTLALNQADAEQLIRLTETGLPYLALLTSTSQTTARGGSPAGHVRLVPAAAVAAVRPGTAAVTPGTAALPGTTSTSQRAR